MKRYSAEFKEALVRKMMPPENVPIMRLAEESGVSYVTLAKWREEVRSGGEAAPGNGEQPDRWSSEDKFLIVLETGVCQPTCRFSGVKVSRALSSFSGLSHALPPI
ncbi:transposase [Aminivibrio sp.]|uniref:transposase n=1 Tax=Aminivibrio sp. TaxID=1872489 RepID=UPI00345EE3B7